MPTLSPLFTSLLLIFVNLCVCLITVPADYNMTMVYTSPPVPENADLDYLMAHNYIRVHNNACFTDANKAKHSVNKAFLIQNMTEALADPNFVKGTTYWLNEYMHVGHVTFDIGLMQIMNAVKVDRLILQRAACHANLCAGLGTFRSFYGAYFAAVFEATHQSPPIFARWAWTERYVNPLFVSIHHPEYEMENKDKVQGIQLQPTMCFERVIRRGPEYFGNFYGAVSSEMVHRFKSAAYSSKNIKQPLTTHFIDSAPIHILISYRGMTATRHMANVELLISTVQERFPEPRYKVVPYDNSNAKVTSEEQIVTMATTNVVITNHGAFEGNLIYLRNGTLMVEMAGNYHNPEFRFFQHFSHMFGVFYTRTQHSELTDHQLDGYNITASEVQEVVDIVQDYVLRKPYSYNCK